MSIVVDLSNRVALVTGATGQLGRVIATTLARAGADVAVHFHGNEAKAAELVGAIEGLGRRAVAVRADVADLQSVRSLGETAQATLGAPDIVVACAVSQVWPWSTVLEEDPADYEDQFRSCVMQNVHLAKTFLPAMKERGWGRYVGINTECLMQMGETMSAYVSGKRGMDGLLRVLAREVGPAGVTVNQVAPGWTISEQDRAAGTEENESYSKTVPLRRRGTDQEVANVVAFLASDLASFVTGALVPVCGGNVMPTV
ncbi:SDR family oxidoreductase [Pelagicoccus sp. SDUM812003]|uniref:SDR family NAD(P)-dependent oxidoreductase n=1 Tax=Pelagicoccus sp. SDUM812003 TaxID=3041267 RepID=UPI00280DAFCF|nr:SDR family oxidoreductase [Pelagicoccus sp. SDUM812003]MDQ8201720.1 SDR family oxidoreductase [Pelagicoccus sp. SDUM812003]